MKVSRFILTKNENFKKLRHDFVDERAVINIFLSLENPCTFCLRKKIPEDAFLTLIVNYRKIVQKNKLCHSKQQKIGYLMIHDVIQSLVLLTENLATNSPKGFIVSLKEHTKRVINFEKLNYTINKKGIRNRVKRQNKCSICKNNFEHKFTNNKNYYRVKRSLLLHW